MVDYRVCAKKLFLSLEDYTVSIPMFHCRINTPAVVDPAFPKSKPSSKQMRFKHWQTE